ncbi:hypothetical protein [Pseudomonas sp. BF-R-19]|uniref:hypothetical protein n=1 Tax=Pseudomonas sp. BF-R-19 TaxID=2832397 RepID=UPI001CBDC45D|nr:hypothetical protein [Pseudomonas sp. BF-R-19]
MNNNSCRTYFGSCLSKREWTYFGDTVFNRNTTLKGLTFWGQWALGQGFVVALLLILVYCQTGTVEFYYRACATLTVLASVPAYTWCGVYAKKDNYLEGLVRLLMGWSMTLAALAIVAFLCKANELFSRQIILTWAFCNYIGKADHYERFQITDRLCL